LRINLWIISTETAHSSFQPRQKYTCIQCGYRPNLLRGFAFDVKRGFKTYLGKYFVPYFYFDWCDSIDAMRHSLLIGFSIIATVGVTPTAIGGTLNAGDILQIGFSTVAPICPSGPCDVLELFFCRTWRL
jgi:hypothetical protein